MFKSPKIFFRAAAEYQPLLRLIGLDSQGIFADPRVVPWRKLSDRENCTLDVDLGDAWPTPRVRLHVKRYFPARGYPTPAEDEVRGHLALSIERIPTAPLVGWGVLRDGRSFTIFDDLAEYRPADKLIEAGTPFATLLEATAHLAADLHNAGLHHRDLYLCHFMARVAARAGALQSPNREGLPNANSPDVRLIDAARVSRLSSYFTRRRWIVKDLAQFWYSTTRLPVTDMQRLDWLDRYALRRGLVLGRASDGLRRAIERKVRSIARHDVSLGLSQPTRNISIPDGAV